MGQHIQPLKIHSAPDGQHMSPMYRLIGTFYSLATLHQGIHEFLMLCNTHTFVIIPNLEDFIANYDSDELYYSGNELAIHYKSPSLLTFASGGAGIVLSHVSLSLILITWSIIQHPDLAILLERDESHRYHCDIFKSRSDRKKHSKVTMNVYDKTSSSYTDMRCVMLYMSDIRKNWNKLLQEEATISYTSFVQKIRIELSRKIRLELHI